jgi:ABC-type phosphate transport system substrate-binding protein
MEQKARDYSCGPPGGTITVAGSALVTPIASAWAVAYQNACHNNVTVTVEGRESDGAERVCGAGASDAPVDVGAISRYVLYALQAP